MKIFLKKAKKNSKKHYSFDSEEKDYEIDLDRVLLYSNDSYLLIILV